MARTRLSPWGGPGREYIALDAGGGEEPPPRLYRTRLGLYGAPMREYPALTREDPSELIVSVGLPVIGIHASLESPLALEVSAGLPTIGIAASLESFLSLSVSLGLPAIGISAAIEVGDPPSSSVDLTEVLSRLSVLEASLSDLRSLIVENQVDMPLLMKYVKTILSDQRTNHDQTQRGLKLKGR